LCGQKCFCDCKVFEEITRNFQAAARQQTSLEEKLLQMGAEPTEMLLASLASRNASRQKPDILTPGVNAATRPAGQGSNGSFRGGQRSNKGSRGGNNRGKQYTYAQVAHTSAQWKHLVDNIEEHDEQLRRERLATIGKEVSETVIRDVYRPTTLSDGRRVESDNILVQQIQVGNGEASGSGIDRRTEAVSTLIEGLASLTLASEFNNEMSRTTAPGIETIDNTTPLLIDIATSPPSDPDRHAEPLSTARDIPKLLSVQLGLPLRATAAPMVSIQTVPESRFVTPFVTATTEEARPQHPEQPEQQPESGADKEEEEWLIEL
jgi:hypothetical protein